MASWTLADVEAIERAIASGALTVKYQDRVVTYRSQKELLALLDLMRRELGLVPSGLTRDLRAITDKGLR